MAAKLDRWILFGAAAMLFLALLACKKDEEATSEPSAAEAPAEPQKAEAAEKAAEAEKPAEDAGAAAAEADAGEVEIKRYGDQEKPETGKAKVTADPLKVYPEADDTKEKVAELKRDTTVELKASYQAYYLIEYADEGDEKKLGWVNRENTVARIVARATPPPPQPEPTPTATERQRRRDIGGGRGRQR